MADGRVDQPSVPAGLAEGAAEEAIGALGERACREGSAEGAAKAATREATAARRDALGASGHPCAGTVRGYNRTTCRTLRQHTHATLRALSAEEQRRQGHDRARRRCDVLEHLGVTTPSSFKSWTEEFVGRRSPLAAFAPVALGGAPLVILHNPSGGAQHRGRLTATDSSASSGLTVDSSIPRSEFLRSVRFGVKAFASSPVARLAALASSSPSPRPHRHRTAAGQRKGSLDVGLRNMLRKMAGTWPGHGLSLLSR